MTLLGIAAELLSRADLPGEEPRLVGYAETQTWEPGAAKALTAAGLLTPASPLDRFSCTECDEPHSESVSYSEPPGSERFIYCPATGRIVITQEQLSQWSVSLTALANAIASAMNTSRPATELLHNRHWYCGTTGSEQLGIHVVRGVQWRDGEALFEHLVGTSQNLVLTLAERLPAWTLSGLCLPVSSLLVTEGGGMRLQIPAVATRVRAPTLQTERCGLRREGKFWHVSWFGSESIVRDLLGFAYLAQLLKNPGKDLGALELLALLGERRDAITGEGSELGVEGAAPQEVIDAEARHDYERQISFLDAKKRSLGLSPDEESELDALRQELRRSTNIRGRTRTMSAPIDKARSGISHALDRVQKSLREEQPAMAAHLKGSITTGSSFSYRPAELIDWEIQLSS